MYLAFIACYSKIDIPPSKWSEQIRSWLLGSQWPLGSTDHFHPKNKRWLVSGPWFRKSVIWPLQPVNFVIPFFDWNIWDTAEVSVRYFAIFGAHKHLWLNFLVRTTYLRSGSMTIHKGTPPEGIALSVTVIPLKYSFKLLIDLFWCMMTHENGRQISRVNSKGILKH